jgi:molybdenum cofactor cytidylyltransferase
MIAAVVLAAGQSKRMGRPKMLLPWGTSTVLGQVICTFRSAGIEEVVVVTGADKAAVEEVVATCQARAVFNADYASDEMLSSLQIGLRAMSTDSEAALVALGDQPQIREQTVRLLAAEYRQTSAALIVPSYQNRRGHPWLIARGLWDELLALHAPQTPRDFLQRRSNEIKYVVIDSPSILDDLDTPDDYLKASW